MENMKTINPNCSWCNHNFHLSEKQENDLKERLAENGKSIRIRCPECKDTTIYNILINNETIELKYEKEVDDRLFCCPVSACIGFVEEDKDGKVFGCSECGTEWKNLDKVHQSIEKIIEKYPHRKKVYQKNGEQWKSISLDEIPKGYYSKVNNEKV